MKKSDLETATREQMVDALVQHRTETIIYDAVNCTSLEEEIASLVRHGIPAVEEMSDGELGEHLLDVLDD